MFTRLFLFCLLILVHMKERKEGGNPYESEAQLPSLLRVASYMLLKEYDLLNNKR